MLRSPLSLALVYFATVAASTPWNTGPDYTINSLESARSRVRSCLVDDNYQATLTALGLRTEIDGTELEIRNVSRTSQTIEINRGFGRYTLAPTETIELVNIRNRDNCIYIQPE